VQGYAFAAFRAMAQMTRRLGGEKADHWLAKAEAVRRRVEERYWMEDAGYYGVAIDGEGALCTPLTSNAGHLLFAGVPDHKRAARVTRRLLSREFDAGWGIRTLATGSARFNPMSYHNGSVWPHDTSICVAGMGLYGERAGPVKMLGDLFQAAQCFGMRMPELLCGFRREEGEPPVAYPVACMPQSWAAGAAFMILQACLGLRVDAARREVRIVRPALPHGVDRLFIDGLEVGDATVSLRFHRHNGVIAVDPGPGSDRSIAVILER
jgi:glycogen debranching enzyme